MDIRNTEMYKSWHRGMTPTRIIKKNTIVRGRGAIIMMVTITNSESSENGRWIVVKEGNKFIARNRDTHTVWEANNLKTIYKNLDMVRRYDKRSLQLRVLQERTCEWESDDPFDDFAVRPLWAYGNIEPECEY